FIKQNAAWLVPLTAAVLGVAAAVWIWNAAMAANPLILVTLAVAALIAAIILLAKNWDKVWAAIKAGALAVWRFMQDVWARIFGVIRAVFDWVRSNWYLLLGILLGPIATAAALIFKYRDQILAAFMWLVGQLGAVFAGVVGVITAPFKWAFNAVA